MPFVLCFFLFFFVCFFKLITRKVKVSSISQLLIFDQIREIPPFFRVTPCQNFIKRYKARKKYANILQHIQFINDVSDVLHLSSGCNSGLQNFN